jgi:tRNA(fMet)-specific endonuclease VapC
MVKYLLDTDGLSEPLRPTPNQGFLKRFRTNEAKLGLAAVTLHEALYGIERLPDGKRKEGLRSYMRDVVQKMSVLPYDAKAAEWHARERARLDAAGRPMPYADGQIAAVAAVHGLTLVTANARDFRHVEGVRVENWFVAR